MYSGGLHSELTGRSNYRGGLTDDAVAAFPKLAPAMRPGDAMVVHANVAHSVGDNTTGRTRAAIAQVYKSARSVDVEPGEGNTRSWAELPAARDGRLAFQLGPALQAAASL